VTVGLASQWPCVTDNSAISTYGLTALEREMSTHNQRSTWRMLAFSLQFTVSVYSHSLNYNHVALQRNSILLGLFQLTIYTASG